MGGVGRRVWRVRDGERERAAREIKRTISGISDEELIRLFGHEKGDVSAVPSPEELGIPQSLLWRALGNPHGITRNDGIPDGLTPDARAEIDRRMERVIQPLLNRLEIIGNRNRRRN